VELVGATKPTTGKAIDALNKAGILKEITGKKRDSRFHPSFWSALQTDNGCRDQKLIGRPSSV
jgi:hypothetical protein